MSIFLEYLPFIAFFIAYKIAGIYVATGVAMGILAIQVAITLCRGKKVAASQWISLGLLSVLGGATIIFHNDIFIKWKVSVLYWLFGLILLGVQVITNKSVLKKIIGKQLTLPEPIWTKLSYAWSAFFFFMGFLNLYVIKHYTTAQWVNFKVFGTMGLLIAFCIAQSIYLNKYMTDNKAEIENGKK